MAQDSGVAPRSDYMDRTKTKAGAREEPQQEGHGLGWTGSAGVSSVWTLLSAAQLAAQMQGPCLGTCILATS